MIIHPIKYIKLLPFGNRWSRNIFGDGKVEVTEKIDGSQFRFGKINGVLRCFSKNTELDVANTKGGLFGPAVTYLNTIGENLIDGIMFFGETLCSKKHNTINYDRVPFNHIALFGACDLVSARWALWSELACFAREMNVDIAPLLWEGEFNGQPDNLSDFLDQLLDRESYLGGHKVEGVVFKNYNQSIIVADQPTPFLGVKHVSEQFKEKHEKNSNFSSATNSWKAFCEQFCNENRWAKARIHLQEQEELVNEPRDIPKLVNEVQRDIFEEHESEIKDFLFNLYRRELASASVKGLAVWYKNKLMEEVLNG